MADMNADYQSKLETEARKYTGIERDVFELRHQQIEICRRQSCQEAISTSAGRRHYSFPAVWQIVHLMPPVCRIAHRNRKSHDHAQKFRTQAASVLSFDGDRFGEMRG